MKRLIQLVSIVISAGLISAGCYNVVDSNKGEGIQSEVINPVSKKNTTTSNTCQTAGDTGLTALYVNQSVNNTTIGFSSHSCDIGIYFDEDSPKNAFVNNTTIIQETGGSGLSTGLWNNGGDVTLSNSVFTTDFSGQYLPVRFDEGAHGSILKNEIGGTHRVGILIRGEGTAADIKGNTIAGTGAKTGGWAENGIQVDQNASVSIKNNEVSGHWWDGESNWASTGILLYDSGASEITGNDLDNNEFGIYLFDSDGSKVSGNRLSSDIKSQSSFNFQAYGALIFGSENHIAGNNFTSSDGAAGIYIYPGSQSNDFTGNQISGFDTSIVDEGTDSKVRGTPAPPNGI